MFELKGITLFGYDHHALSRIINMNFTRKCEGRIGIIRR